MTIASADGIANTFVYEQPGTTSLPVSARGWLAGWLRVCCVIPIYSAWSVFSMCVSSHHALRFGMCECVQTTFELPRAMLACAQSNTMSVSTMNGCGTSPSVTANITGPPCRK